MTLVEEFADFAYATKIEPGDDAVRPELVRRLVDAVGCALGGMGGPTATALRTLAQSRPIVDGGAHVWGSHIKTTPEVAALVNSAAVRYLDYNDHIVGGHPSDNIPAIIAACEDSGATAGDLLAATLVNYEVFGELGRLQVRDRGWDLGTTGATASACATGRALRLTRDQLANGIAIAVTSHIAARKGRRGALSMWKGLATPYAAQCGLWASYMARAGITGPWDAFEGPDGFWNQVTGKPFHIERLQTGVPWYLFTGNYKFWPVEFNAQLAVWLGLEIHAALASSDIQSIVVETNAYGFSDIGSGPEKWDPKTRETADHSLPYVLSVAILRAGISLQDFTEAALADRERRALMARIQVVKADDLTDQFPAVYAMRARVRLVDDREFDFTVQDPRGHNRNPMSNEELSSKFRELSIGGPLENRADELLAGLFTLDAGSDLSKVLAYLVPRPSSDQVD